MDEHRFDSLTRDLATTFSRRGGMRLLAAAGASFLALARGKSDAAAQRYLTAGDPCYDSSQCRAADTPLVCADNGFDYDGPLNCCTYEDGRCYADEHCCGTAFCNANGRCSYAQSTHQTRATPVRPPTSAGAPRPAPFASTPPRPETPAAAGTRARIAPLAPSAVAHESAPVEFANSPAGARAEAVATRPLVEAVAPRARGKAATACCGATQIAVPVAPCMTRATRGSSVPGPPTSSGRAFRHEADLPASGARPRTAGMSRSVICKRCPRCVPLA